MKWSFLALAFLLVASVSQAEKQPSVKSAAKQTHQTLTAPQIHDPFEDFREFSALKSGGMGRDVNRQVYRSGELMRIDLKDSYHITDLSKRYTWVVYGDKCEKVPLPDSSTYPIKAFPDFDVERTMTADKETVDGHTCKIENVTYRQKDGDATIRVKFFEAEDLNGFPVKAEIDYGRKDKTIVTYSDVTLKAPDPSLFKRPANCVAAIAATQKPTAVINVKPQQKSSSAEPQ